MKNVYNMEKYNKLLVIDKYYKKYGTKNKKRLMFLCQCDCGSPEKEIDGNHVKRGNIKSCGCLHKERIIKNNKKYNNYDIYEDGICVGYDLHDNKFYFDYIDYEKIKDICWHYSSKNYIIGNKCGKDISFHKYILGLIDDNTYDIDHIDRNPSNNTRENLRICTHADNLKNSKMRSSNKSGIIGVFFDKENDKWRVLFGGKGYQRFSNFEDAVIERLKMEKEFYGEFAPQRHLFEEYGII